MPMRLDTVVGEALSGISAGQRQRILLARALAGSPRILFIDEATNNLDVAAGANIMAALRALDVTLVICAHRPEVLKHGDWLLTVEQGRIRAQSCCGGLRLATRSCIWNGVDAARYWCS